MTTWTVGQVADLFGVTVRTLHHYDEIGLLTPSERSRAGYRLYTDADLVRLQQIVVYRRPLEEIASLLDGGEDAVTHLRRQREAVLTRLDELKELVGAIDRALEREMTDQPAKPEEPEGASSARDSATSTRPRRRSAGARPTPGSSRRIGLRYTKAHWAEVKAEMEETHAASPGQEGRRTRDERGRDGRRRGPSAEHPPAVLRPRP